ncbi:MAG: hypothetical protein Ct9H300mP8_09320 [Gammaproteobacteria bacterium]|nr:MAG: hypothetical protein Ct9H300mP8_09320 [Gammaproteobacteria bacterium]
MLRAIERIEGEISTAVLGLDVNDQSRIDSAKIELMEPRIRVGLGRMRFSECRSPLLERQLVLVVLNCINTLRSSLALLMCVCQCQ